MAELYSYANPDDEQQPQDADSVMATYNYLSAVRLLFEEGFLCSKPGSSKIKDMDSPILQKIQEGYQYFKNWWIQLDDASMY